jgi:hypothetical protein
MKKEVYALSIYTDMSSIWVRTKPHLWGIDGDLTIVHDRKSHDHDFLSENKISLTIDITYSFLRELQKAKCDFPEVAIKTSTSETV